VELFYQIKGGQVDYGQDHAKTFGLIQKPEAKNFPGLYPDWDQSHPIHIIGHSMGGQTARVLQYLLESVFYLEEEKKQPEESTLLGYVHTGWITSITTISTPHNGTTLSDIITKGIPFLQDVMGVAAVVGNDFFDFDLQQWGFEKRREETWVTYFRRMREHKAWGTRNMCAWDVSLEGAKSLNTLTPVSSNIYYFSYATSNTKLDSASGFHVPHKSMNLILRANARIMGRKKAYWTDGTATDSTWYENDGIVNTISQLGPTTGTDGEDHNVAYKADELLIPGQWYHIKTYNLDHKAFIGHGLKGDEKINEMLALFKDQCNLLQSLPAKE
jgi:triacylglycerol lipase